MNPKVTSQFTGEPACSWSLRVRLSESLGGLADANLWAALGRTLPGAIPQRWAGTCADSRFKNGAGRAGKTALV